MIPGDRRDRALCGGLPDPLPGRCWRCHLVGRDAPARDDGPSCPDCFQVIKRLAEEHRSASAVISRHAAEEPPAGVH